jgi:hypothetical protein
MLRPRIGICLAAACCAFACGDRPDLPGPTAPSGRVTAASTGSGGSGGGVTVLEAEPRPAPPDPVEPSPVSLPDAGPPDVVDNAASQSSPDPVIPGVVSACTVTAMGCVRLFIAAADVEADSCLQLSLDNCNDTTRAGFAVNLPLTWRFGSGFVSELGDECVPRTSFLTRDTAFVSATGSIDWNEDTRQPSQIVIDITLQPSSAALDSNPIRLSNSDLVEPLVDCGG